jgi:long-subunit fatty acid transport protein
MGIKKVFRDADAVSLISHIPHRASHTAHPLFAIVATLFLLFMFFPSLCHAVFTEQLAIDSKAISLANTVTADPPGVMSIHYNPAGLSNLPDGGVFAQGIALPVIQQTAKFTPDPDFEGFLGGFNQDPLANTQGTNTSGKMYIPFYGTLDFLLSPTLGFSHRKKGSRWTFALGTYAPIAIGIVHGDYDDPARFGGKSVYQQHLIYAAPTVSYRMTSSLSLGLSVGFGQSAMGAQVDMRDPNDLVALTRVLGNATEGLEIPVLSELTLPPPWFGGGVGPYDQVASMDLSLRDDFSPSYNLGLLWQPREWFSFGLCYHSAIKVNFSGDYRFDYTDVWQRMVHWFGSSPLLVNVSGMLDLPIHEVPSQSGSATAEMTFPQMLQFGIKVKPFKRLSLLADLLWSNWSVEDQDKIVFDQDIQLLRVVKLMGYTGGDRALIIKRNFRNTWTWSVGLEYQLLDWLALRCGYEKRKSSVREEYFDLLYSIPDLDYYGGGFGIKLKKNLSIDVGFAYIINKSFKIPDNGSVNLNSTEFTKPVYNPYAGLDMDLKTVSYIAAITITKRF